MFRCEHCKKVSEPKEKPVTVVNQVRNVQYHNEFFREDEFGNRKREKVDSFGTEIVKESKLCHECAADYGVEASA